MAQLTQITQRLKTISVIRKTMHAMRLIAMSLHSRYKNMLTSARAYSNEIERIASLIPHEDIHAMSESRHRCLIFITPLRGLCGARISELLHYIQNNEPTPQEVITVGTPAGNFAQAHKYRTILHIKNMTSAELGSTVQQIWSHLAQYNIDEITVYSLKSHSFFVQKPTKKTLYLTGAIPTNHNNVDISIQKPADLLASLYRERARAHLYYILIEACIAEQAARFVAMHNATQNADRITSDLHLAYNKTRQTKVTSELADLTGNLLDLE